MSQHFELHYTPQKGAWFKMAEIEFVALATQCLDRRLAAGAALRQEVLAWAIKRNHEHKPVHWRFSQTDARTKLQRHYQNVQKFI